MTLNVFDEIGNSAPEYIQVYVDLVFDLTDKFHTLLQKSNLTFQDVCNQLEVPEDELMSRVSSCDLKTIAKLTVLFQEPFFTINN